MSLRFYVDNLVKGANIIASENNSQFPSENIKDDRRSKIYRSLTSSCDIVFDLGDIRQIDTIAIVDSNIDIIGFESAIIQLNNTNSWTSPPVSENLTIDTQNGWVNFNWNTDQPYRFARLVLTNGTNPVEVSKVFIGKSSYLENVCFGYPITFKQNNRASVSQNKYGQKFFDEISTQKELSGEIPSLNKDEMDLILSILDYASFTRPIWLFFGASNFLNDQNRLCGYYYLSDDPSMSLQAGNFWTLALSFQEGM
jgi:hypothetical protein